MFVLRATAKLRQRIGLSASHDVEESTTLLGDWYATMLPWRPQVALLVNERALLPALMPLAPAATMPARVADQVGDVLAARGVPDLVTRAEVDQMRQWRITPTASRRIVGVINEFAFLAGTWRDATTSRGPPRTPGTWWSTPSPPGSTRMPPPSTSSRQSRKSETSTPSSRTWSPCRAWSGCPRSRTWPATPARRRCRTALLGYPVLQAADILCVKAHVVPVGKDNAAHVEVTREIARRFNHLYGEVFPVPDLVSAETPTLVGTDGRAKMSKSLGNAIALSDEPAEARRKVMGMYTDPNRIRADVPGTVEGNPVFKYHDVFNPNRAEVDDLKGRYREGKVGDVEVKEKLATALNAFLDLMRERRARYEADKGLVDELIVKGTERTRREVQQTMFEARKAMGLAGVYTQLRRKAERSRKPAATTA